MKIGDRIVFGEVYCEKTGSPYLLNQTIMLTPQYFEEDNGLYTYQVECPGIPPIEEDEEPESIYHLFGESLEGIYDCEIIPAKEEDVLMIKKMQEEREHAINEDYRKMGEYFSKLES